MPCRKIIVATPLPQVAMQKEENFWMWYREALEKGDLVDFSLEDPCFIPRPESCAIWERIQTSLDHRLNRMGIRSSSMDDENHGIRTHQDLPLRVSQWKSLHCDPSHPQPFLRARELLLQEIHTTHETEKDANEEIEQLLDIYATLYEDLLAVPIIKGQRSRLANKRSTAVFHAVEVNKETIALAYIPALDQYIEAATCQTAGQSISKDNSTTAPNPLIPSTECSRPPQHVWPNSYSFSNRALGIMLATHGDNEGLILPPHVAEHQVIIIPQWTARNAHELPCLQAGISSIETALTARHIRVKVDFEHGLSPGWKLQAWRIRGAPLCVILGMKELSGQDNYPAAVYRRHLQKKDSKVEVSLAELSTTIPTLLEDIQGHLCRKASDAGVSCRCQVNDWQEFVHCLCHKEGARMCLAPHCLAEECEQQIRNLVTESARDGVVDAKVTCLCIPWSQPSSKPSPFRCINYQCESEAHKWAMFGYEVQ